MQRWQRGAWMTWAVLAGCGSGQAPPMAGADGTPTTGSVGASPGAEGSAPERAGPDGLAIQREAVQALVVKAGASVDLDRAGREPLVGLEVSLDEASRSFTAVATIDVVNAGEAALTSLDFELPLNRGADPRLTIDRVEVDGRLVDPRGDRARWTLPVTVAPKARARVVVRLAGKLDAPTPKVAVPRDAPPEPPPELAQILPSGVLPFVPSARPAQAVGERGGVTVLWGLVPRLAGAARMTVDLTLVAPSDLAVVATGVEVGRERRGAATAFHLIAVDVPDLAIVAARGLAASQGKAGAVTLGALVPTDAAAMAADALGVARRAIEALEPGWGRLPAPELRVVACPTLDGAGVVALPGLVLVPAALFHGPGPALKDDLAGALLAHHPAPQEALDFAVATGVAAQWWLGRGADPAAALVLEQGVARAGALRAMDDKRGDKAARRALELGLRLPYQVARMAGGPEPVLARSDLDAPDRSATGPDAGAFADQAAPAKAGLFGDALARHLGAQLFDAALRGLGAAPVTLAALREALLARAPRRAETEALVARWLDDAKADEDVGPIRPEVLLEYLVADGAVDGAMRTLMDELRQRPDLIGRGVGGALKDGLTPGLALSLLDELTGPKDPSLQKWLDTAKGLLGADRDAQLQKLVDELGAELGLPEVERARLRQMSGIVFKALGEDGPKLPDAGDAPDGGPEPEPELEPADR